MAKLGINTGTSPNDGTGDSLLQGAIKINSNFNEIYSAIGNGTTITNFATGPVLIGSASSTGTILQTLQVTGGAYISSSVGIGTTNPLSKFEVCDGDIKVGVNTSNGLILTSQNGTKYRILVNNDGSISSVAV
jgi:hypothetical protein